MRRVLSAVLGSYLLAAVVSSVAPVAHRSLDPAEKAALA
jgi:hypothetical protein